ncbi:MAG: RDD family protein [Candidatus Latescibacteria bacterium]|nr:RDD family protein [Candidatus Latescibacterota bacterium]
MEWWRVLAWLITIGAALIILSLFAIPPIAWWVYKRSSVPLEHRYKTFWARLWASWTDGLVLMPVALLFWYLLLSKTSLWETARWLAVIVLIMHHAYSWFFSIFMHGRWGQTVGKMVTRVKVVDATTEEPITYKKAFLRDAVPILLVFPLHAHSLYQLITGAEYQGFQPNFGLSAQAGGTTWTGFIVWIWWFAEIVSMLTNEKRRAIHDFIAGTVVVRTNIVEPMEEE